MSGRFSATAPLPLGIVPVTHCRGSWIGRGTHCRGSWIGRRIDLDDLEKRQKYCSCWRFQPTFPECPAHSSHCTDWAIPTSNNSAIHIL